MFYLLCIGSGQAWSITACSSLGSIRPHGYSRFSSSRRDVCSCGSDSATTAYDIERQLRMYGPSWEPRLLVCDGIPGSSPAWISPIPERSGFCGSMPNDHSHSRFALDERTPDADPFDRHSHTLVRDRDFGRCSLAIRADWALAVAGFALLGASMAPKKVGIIGAVMFSGNCFGRRGAADFRE